MLAPPGPSLTLAAAQRVLSEKQLQRDRLLSEVAKRPSSGLSYKAVKTRRQQIDSQIEELDLEIGKLKTDVRRLMKEEYG